MKVDTYKCDMCGVSMDNPYIKAVDFVKHYVEVDLCKDCYQWLLEAFKGKKKSIIVADMKKTDSDKTLEWLEKTLKDLKGFKKDVQYVPYYVPYWSWPYYKPTITWDSPSTGWNSPNKPWDAFKVTCDSSSTACDSDTTAKSNSQTTVYSEGCGSRV